jgi:hypothetical protein
MWEGDISDRTVSRALKRIEFTRKKNYGYRERNEQERADFLRQLETVVIVMN